jgi:type II secretory pathway predicted ATPase ExeA
MYESYFGLRGRPFRPTPDADSYYPATGHEQTLDRLRQGFAEGEGLALLTGSPGTGKTLLCHVLLERSGDHFNAAFLTNSHVANAAGLLQAVLHDLSLPHENRGEQALRLALTDFLLKSYAEGRQTLLIMDEAQNLPREALEELRLMGNLEGREGKAIQILLVAQPEFLGTLNSAPSAALRQRLAVRAHLDHLAEEEAVDYLLHQVRVAGGRPDELFAEDTLALLARATGGVPRLLNQAAHQALALTFRAEMRQVDVEAAVEALALCGIESNLEDGENTERLPAEEHEFKYYPRANGKANHGADDGQNA